MVSHRFRPCSLVFLGALAVNAVAVSLVVAGDVADFKSPLDNSPIMFELQTGFAIFGPVSDKGLSLTAFHHEMLWQAGFHATWWQVRLAIARAEWHRRFGA